MIHAFSAALLGAATLDVPTRDLLFSSIPKFPSPPPSATPSPPVECPEDWDAAVMELFKGGQFEACSPEAMYWTHHPDVYGGYSGCVAESGLYPCDQDGWGFSTAEDWKKKYVWNADTETCDETGYTVEETRFWILWGHPMDKFELNKRTGLNPVIKFPYLRGPYPRDEDWADLWPTHKDWLEYLGAHTREYLDTFGAYPSEGAEQSMDLMYAAKALELARKSCTRTVYVFVEAPGYGYDFGQAARWANTRAGSSFYSGTECSCYAAGTCEDGTISFSQVGWFPGTPMPEAMGGDGQMYMAGDNSLNSPWIETLVMPENPSGVIKTPQFTDVTRRVCDGVYMYPMYFGMTENVIPLDKVPECSGWAYSITKVYSAAFRAGVVSYKLDQPDFGSALGQMWSLSRSGANGIYSDMSWKGYIQFMTLAMERPVDDPTSWIGAYTEIQNEKWAAIIEAAEGCPFMEITNPYAGAYSFWKAKGEGMGLVISGYFLAGFGVQATSYSWGFRGADPSDMYGPGYNTTDFVRMQLYRDLNVYKEVARRIKVVCSGGTVPGWMSFEEWKKMREEEMAADDDMRRRKLSAEEHFALIKKHAPHLSDAQAVRIAEDRAVHEETEGRILTECAPAYSTSCVMGVTGHMGKDLKPGELPKRHPTTYKEKRMRRLAAKKRQLEAKKRQERRQLHEHEDDTMDTLMTCAMEEAQGGAFEVCPAESFYWAHHPDVFGGYEGCVGESTLVPCAQDGFGGLSAMEAYNKTYVWNAESGECEESGYTFEQQSFWILWGHPMDKFELNKRTGTNFVVTFPFLRGPYPNDDESADLWPTHKDWLEYLGAGTRAYLDEFEGFTTEGAEQSMDLLYAAKALEIARSTCNREIHVFTEAPGYGYDFGQAARWANTRASSFYSGEECLCFPNCNDGTISFRQRGWFPGTDFPVALGGDNVTYVATSSSPTSPWIETLVMPENPSGTIKTPQLPRVERRVCDGVYMYPMYFGMTGNKIPLDRIPDCCGWAYSITKVYSAAFRAGAVSAKIDQPEFTEALSQMVGLSQSGANGQYSDMSWMGYIQFMNFAMERPVDDPTSWIGAYSELQNEKWKLIIDAAEGCPFMEITNPYAGAYSFWKARGEGLGLDIYLFFWDGFGVEATSYSWGFRGADPADYYGEGVTTMDFVRMQLYRDLGVYKEVARRIGIVCSGEAVPGWMSFAEWKAMREAEIAAEGGRRRKLSVGQQLAYVKKAAPHLSDAHANRIAKRRVLRQEQEATIEKECARENYASSCLMQYLKEN